MWASCHLRKKQFSKQKQQTAKLNRAAATESDLALFLPLRPSSNAPGLLPVIEEELKSPSQQGERLHHTHNWSDQEMTPLRQLIWQCTCVSRCESSQSSSPQTCIPVTEHCKPEHHCVCVSTNWCDPRRASGACVSRLECAHQLGGQPVGRQQSLTSHAYMSDQQQQQQEGEHARPRPRNTRGASRSQQGDQHPASQQQQHNQLPHSQQQPHSPHQAASGGGTVPSPARGVDPDVLARRHARMLEVGFPAEPLPAGSTAADGELLPSQSPGGSQQLMAPMQAAARRNFKSGLNISRLAYIYEGEGWVGVGVGCDAIGAAQKRPAHCWRRAVA